MTHEKENTSMTINETGAGHDAAVPRIHFVKSWRQALTGRPFDRIVLPREPQTPEEHEYVRDVLRTRLVPGGVVVVSPHGTVLANTDAARKGLAELLYSLHASKVTEGGCDLDEQRAADVIFSSDWLAGYVQERVTDYAVRERPVIRIETTADQRQVIEWAVATALAAERERIAAGIKAKADDIAERSQLSADTKFRIGLAFSSATDIVWSVS